MPAHKSASDTKEQPFDNPLNGKFIHPGAEDPVKIGETDFQKLVNIRYTPTGIRGTSGMTKVNSNALPANNVTDGMQFNKYLPMGLGNFSYNLVHVTDGVSSSELVRSDNTAVPPNPDTYSVLIPSMAYSASNVEMTTAPDGAAVICDGVTNWIWGGDEFRCSAFICSGDPSSYFFFAPEDYTKEVNNSLTTPANIATLSWGVLSGTYAVATILVGSTRPLNGIKFYVHGPNAISGSTISVGYYAATSSTFVPCTNIVDGTNTGTTTLSKTGTVTFDSTDGLAAVALINGEVLYWYPVTIQMPGLTHGVVTISSCTLSAAAQSIKDIWDGVDRAEATYIVDAKGYAAVVLHDTPPSDDSATGAGYYYVDLSTLANSSIQYVGFTERMSGMKFSFSNAITTAGGTMTVKYWNGTAWVAVSGLIDNTSAFGKSGAVFWTPPPIENEFQRVNSVDQFLPLFLYQITFSTTIANTVHLYYVAGIPAQTDIQAHTIPVLWQNRLWLLANKQGNANEGLCSSSGSNCVFNGSDSITLNFGDNTPALAAGSLYSRYGGSIYDNLVVVKAYQTYLVDGTSSSTWIVYTIAPNVGITAPKTFTICDIGYEIAPGLTKHIAAWVSSAGPVMFDGNGIIPIEGDIKCFWDPTSPYFVAPSVMALASAWFDGVYREWHLVFDGLEFVYDVMKKKWWQAERGSGKALACGWQVKTSTGYIYAYAGTSDGSIEVLERGTTMDGNSIQYSMRTGDTPLAKSAMATVQVRRVKLVAKPKQHDDAVAFNHYGDGILTPSLVTRLVQNTQYGTRRIYQAVMEHGPNCLMEGVFHSFEAESYTTDEEIGFEPIMISGTWEFTREDVYGRY